MQYFGSFFCNNGPTFGQGYTDSNLRRLRKLIRAIAEGNTFAGNSANWQIRDLEGKTVAEGTIQR